MLGFRCQICLTDIPRGKFCHACARELKLHVGRVRSRLAVNAKTIAINELIMARLDKAERTVRGD